MSSSTDTTLSIEIRMQTFPPLELRHVSPWKHPTDYSGRGTDSSEFEEIAIVPPVIKPKVDISLWQTFTIITNVSCIMLLNSMLGGLLVVGLPAISKDVKLSGTLLLWPVSVTALTCGCTLLVFGSISDVIGPRRVYITGCLIMTATTVACGVARTGVEFILFRAFQGLALSLCLPSAVQLITCNISSGARRNIAFASLGAGQPIGFALGLVIGGLFVQGIGWRYGYWIATGIIFIVFLLSIMGLPPDRNIYRVDTMRRLRTEIDWTGCLILSASLGSFSYVLSVLAGGASNIVSPLPLTLLILSMLLIFVFSFHIYRQQHRAKPFLFPLSLWTNLVFTSLCITIFLSWAIFQSIQIFLTLYWQLIAHNSTTATSLQFLPMVISGMVVNFAAGHYVSRIPANYLVFVAAIATAISPLLLALIPVRSTYWTYGFWATGLSPVAVDVLFTVSNLVITAAFEERMHGVSGGVLNTVLNIGQSFGVSLSAVIAQSVTIRSHNRGEAALMEGYRVVFWVCFGVGIAVVLIVLVGLRGIGKVGSKKDKEVLE